MLEKPNNTEQFKPCALFHYDGSYDSNYGGYVVWRGTWCDKVAVFVDEDAAIEYASHRNELVAKRGTDKLMEEGQSHEQPQHAPLGDYHFGDDYFFGFFGNEEGQAPE